MPLLQVNTFWMDLCSICYFVVILFYIERKWLLMRNLARILPWKSKLSGKFQRFSAIDGELLKCWKRVEFPKISIKMKNCKTFCEAQTASRLMEIVQPPTKPNPTQKNLTTSLEQKFSYGDIQKYMDICFQRASRIEFLSVKKWCSANFLTRNRNTFFRKFVKSGRFLAGFETFC